jgi:hypothetical protein
MLRSKLNGDLIYRKFVERTPKEHIKAQFSGCLFIGQVGEDTAHVVNKDSKIFLFIKDTGEDLSGGDFWDVNGAGSARARLIRDASEDSYRTLSRIFLR